jgi:uncharacterized membrane protein
MVLGSYATYLVISIAVTIFVAQTLRSNGRAFLIDAYTGNQRVAVALSHLLIVGFYLIGLGYVAIALNHGTHPADLVQAVDVTSHKLGGVLIILGIIHFITFKIFTSMRRRALNGNAKQAPAEGVQS